MNIKKSASVASIVLGTLLMTMSCEDSSVIKPSNQAVASNPTKSASQTGNRITNYTFDGTEGGAITLATASSWVFNYIIQNSYTIKSHFVGATAIKKILASNGCVGVRIYYSLDDNGNKQLLLIGADNKGNDLQAAGIKGKLSTANLTGGSNTDSFAGNEGDLISDAVSKQWMTNYTSQNPSSLIAHFFGFAILNKIMNQTDCIGIRMYYALNDSGIQQVLLVGVNSNGENILPTSTGGRTADDGTIGDMSFPCPTYCSGGGG